MPLSRLPLPSLSVVLTSSSLDGPVELFNMTDSGHALRREIHLNTQPTDDDPLMKTLDTRFAGSFAYSATYTTGQTDKDATTGAHVHHVSAASTRSPSSSSNDRDDALTTSTAEGDFNREHMANMPQNIGPTTTFSDSGSEYEVGQLGEDLPPLHLPLPSAARQRLPPVHRQPGSLSSLESIPPLPLRNFESDKAMRVLGSGRRSSDSWSPNPTPWTEHWSRVSNARRPPSRGPSLSGQLARARAAFLLKAFGFVRAFWWKVKRVGGVILHECTKDL